MLESSRGCLYVCLCVCVCLCQLYSPKGRADFDENPHKYSLGCSPVLFFSDFENFNSMTSWRPFCIKRLEHSNVGIWTSIFFKFTHDVAYIRALFAIENQPDREISLIKNGVPRIGRGPFWAKNQNSSVCFCSSSTAQGAMPIWLKIHINTL